jgi:integrase
MGDIAAGTERMYRVKCRHVGRLLGGLDVAALTPEDVTRFIAVRREEGASSHTIAKELVALRRMLAHAERQGRVGPGWRACVPARFKTGYAPRDRWLTEDEYLLLVDALPDARRIWLRAAVYLGGRESELRQIDWADVDLRLGFVAVRTAKVRKGEPVKVRHIPIADELRAALEAVPKVARKGPLLPCWCNGALMVARYGQKAGILKAPVYERVPSPRGTKRGRLLEHGECLSPNDLRRTFASWMLQGGAQVKEVADLMGHGSIAMVEKIYGHLAAKNLVHAVARMPVFGKVARRRIRGAR